MLGLCMSWLNGRTLTFMAKISLLFLPAWNAYFEQLDAFASPPTPFYIKMWCVWASLCHLRTRTHTHTHARARHRGRRMR